MRRPGDEVKEKDQGASNGNEARTVLEKERAEALATRQKK